MDLYITAFYLNHYVLALYAFRYLHCSLTLLSRGGTNFLVFTQTLIYTRRHLMHDEKLNDALGNHIYVICMTKGDFA